MTLKHVPWSVFWEGLGKARWEGDGVEVVVYPKLLREQAYLRGRKLSILKHLCWSFSVYSWGQGKSSILCSGSESMGYELYQGILCNPHRNLVQMHKCTLQEGSSIHATTLVKRCSSSEANYSLLSQWVRWTWKDLLSRALLKRESEVRASQVPASYGWGLNVGATLH